MDPKQDASAAAAPLTVSIERIMEMIPHRYPFLMIDRVVDVVRDASASFDRYWNSEVVYPISLLSPENVNPESLEQLRVKLAAAMEVAKKSRYAEALRRDDNLARLDAAVAGL
jgi:hypothetical protein